MAWYCPSCKKIFKSRKTKKYFIDGYSITLRLCSLCHHSVYRPKDVPLSFLKNFFYKLRKEKEEYPREFKNINERIKKIRWKNKKNGNSLMA